MAVEFLKGEKPLRFRCMSPITAVQRGSLHEKRVILGTKDGNVVTVRQKAEPVVTELKVGVEHRVSAAMLARKVEPQVSYTTAVARARLGLDYAREDLQGSGFRVVSTEVRPARYYLLYSESDVAGPDSYRFTGPADRNHFATVAASLYDEKIAANFAGSGFPSTDALETLIDRSTAAPEDLDEYINEHILTALLRTRALLERITFPRIQRHLELADTPAFELVTFLHTIHTQFQGIDLLSNHFSHSGAVRVSDSERAMVEKEAALLI
jgi:hypothetical protein